MKKNIKDKMPTASCIYGGNWKDLGETRINRWPGIIGEKRPIKVDINSWIGTSLGARHWYVTVKENDNMWWDEHRDMWRELWDDSEKGGYELDKASVYTEDEAIQLAIFFIKLIHPKNYKKQIIYWNGPGKPSWCK